MFAQIIAICIFVTMFLLIILDKFERHYITLGSGALVLVLVFGVCMRSMSAIWETLNLGAFFQSTFWYGASEESTAGINWSTILFIAGMMIMVEGLGKAGFFRWLCLTLAKLVHYRTVPLLICFMSLSAFLSMFIDSITVVLFLATVTLELAQTMKFDPVPMILSEIFLREPRRRGHDVRRPAEHHHRHLARLHILRLHRKYRRGRGDLLCVHAHLLHALLPQGT